MKIFKEFEGKTAFVTGAASGIGAGRSYLFWRSWLQGGCGCQKSQSIGNGADYTGKRR